MALHASSAVKQPQLLVVRPPRLYALIGRLHHRRWVGEPAIGSTDRRESEGSVQTHDRRGEAAAV
jgi:hypothetical protein